MKHTTLCLLAALLALTGCHEDEPTAAPPEEPPEEAPVDVEEAAPPPTRLAVARTLKFARQEGGVSLGFDLDARISERGDRETCGQGDFTTPDGEGGIDNAFANVLPIIERVGGTALEGLVQAAINEGDLLVMLEVDGIDSLEQDDAVTVTLLRGIGQPFVGTDDRIEGWQTYDVDPAAPWSKADARIADGILEAGPLEIELPIYVFDFEFLVTVTDARLRVAFGEDGPEWAVLGGTILMENLLDIANNIEGGQNIPGTLDTIGRTFADMVKLEDGSCAGISVTLDISLAGAFFYDDVERPDR